LEGAIRVDHRKRTPPPFQFLAMAGLGLRKRREFRWLELGGEEVGCPLFLHDHRAPSL